MRFAWVMTCQLADDVFLTNYSVFIDVTLTCLSYVDTISPPMLPGMTLRTESALCA